MAKGNSNHRRANLQYSGPPHGPSTHPEDSEAIQKAPVSAVEEELNVISSSMITPVHIYSVVSKTRSLRGQKNYGERRQETDL